jgi:hypothetical protein
MYTISKGSYVPTLTFSTTNPSGSAVVKVGEYMRIGKEVHFWLKITQTTEGTGASGDIQVGLPSVPNGKFRAWICGETLSVAGQSGSMGLVVKWASGQICKISDMVEAGTHTVLTHAAIGNGSVIEIAGVYEEA